MRPHLVLLLPPALPDSLNEELHLVTAALTRLLGPLRETRPGGHRALRTLLGDPASHAAVVAHLAELSEFAVLLYPYYLERRALVAAWRREYGAAPPARRAQIRTAYRPREATALLDGLRRLYLEAHADVEQFMRFAPGDFRAPGPPA